MDMVPRSERGFWNGAHYKHGRLCLRCCCILGHLPSHVLVCASWHDTSANLNM